MTTTEPDPAPSRRKLLRIGTGFLPTLFGEGLHSYRVTHDPLPKDVEIIGAQMGLGLRDVVLLIESAEFPEVQSGQPYPEICPQFTRVDL